MEAGSNSLFQCFKLPQFNTDLSDLEFDANGEPLQRRRSRGKSRTGCDKCKERRVKCDERHPSCLNCTKLRLVCGFSNAAPSKLAIHPKFDFFSSPLSWNASSFQYDWLGNSDWLSKSGKTFNALTVLPTPISHGNYPPINMSHLELFHHFWTVTSETLVFGVQMWSETLLRYSFKHKFLMHAMLLMAASHLRYLHPEEPRRHHLQELEHFSQALPAFTAALSDSITADNAYPLLACSALILQYQWACHDLTDHGLDNFLDLGFGNLIGLYSGMRQLGLASLPITINDPFLYPFMFYRPIFNIKGYSENTNIPLELESFFTHCCQCQKWSGVAEGNFNIRMNAARSLIPVLSAVKLGIAELEASSLMSDISRVLFILPLFTTSEFAQLVKDNDEAALLILLHYYALVLRLLSEKYWWMRDRSAHVCKSILTKLGNKCERCLGCVRELCAGGRVLLADLI